MIIVYRLTDVTKLRVIWALGAHNEQEADKDKKMDREKLNMYRVNM
jgi:hypothetical protein